MTTRLLWFASFAFVGRHWIGQRGRRIRYGLTCGCEVTKRVAPGSERALDDDVDDPRWCAPHRQLHDAEQRRAAKRAEQERPPVTAEEARAWVEEMREASRNMREGEREEERRRRFGR